MISWAKLFRIAHRLLVRVGSGRLRSLWAGGYLLLARMWIAYLMRGQPQATAYLRGSLTSGDLLPGLSDIDVVIVLRPHGGRPGWAADQALARWMRLRRALPRTDLVLDYPLVLEQDELDQAVGSSALTYRSAVYNGLRVSQDMIRVLERPGIYGTCSNWRTVRGRDRRPPEPPQDRQRQRIAAWLELCAWWRWVPGACTQPDGPRTASLCVKLVAEPIRIWLWLAHEVRTGTRAETLMAALPRLPEEEAALNAALSLLGALPRSPVAPLAETLPALVRTSRRITLLIADEISEAGVTQVQLCGEDTILARGPWLPTPALDGGAAPTPLPLCDCRTMFEPRFLDESFVPFHRDPGDPELIRVASVSQASGPYPALVAGDLLVMLGTRARTQLRALKAPMTDPVSFALLHGRQSAAFPDVGGWSAHDLARRAITEHRAWLSMPAGGAEPEGVSLAKLLSAARAGLFAKSLDDGAPELAVTVSEVARRLGEQSSSARTVAEESLERYREFAEHRTKPPADTLAAMRRLVLGLDAFKADQTRAPA